MPNDIADMPLNRRAIIATEPSRAPEPPPTAVRFEKVELSMPNKDWYVLDLRAVVPAAGIQAAVDDYCLVPLCRPLRAALDANPAVRAARVALGQQRQLAQGVEAEQAKIRAMLTALEERRQTCLTDPAAAAGAAIELRKIQREQQDQQAAAQMLTDSQAAVDRVAEDKRRAARAFFDQELDRQVAAAFGRLFERERELLRHGDTAYLPELALVKRCQDVLRARGSYRALANNEFEQALGLK
jgi:hypothetical protein